MCIRDSLNTMHSRAGAQTPFSSINYGMDTTPEGRMAMKNVLLVTEAGLGNGETPIFPIQIFRVKEGVNYNPVSYTHLGGGRTVPPPGADCPGRPVAGRRGNCGHSSPALPCAWGCLLYTSRCV